MAWYSPLTMAVFASGLGRGPNRSTGVGGSGGVGGVGGVVSVTPGENSEVLNRFADPAGDDGSAVRFVAVAVMNWPRARVTFNVVSNDATPEASVVTLIAPRNVLPSAGRPSGSA